MATYKPLYSSTLLLILLFIFSLHLARFGSAQFSITGFDPADLRSEARLTGLFQQWMDKHGKAYRNADETVKRFENFKRNVEFVVEWNSKGSGHVVGLNRFADLSNDEFREVYVGKIKRPVRVSEPSGTRRELLSVCHAPVSLDWRKKGVVTAVKDQGQFGSCWAISATGAIEGINAINTGELISLSERDIVHHFTTDDGFDGVFTSDAFEWVINNGWINTDDKGVNKVVSIDNYEAVEESETALRCAVVKQPVSAAVDASALEFQLYIGGVYEGSCSSNPNDTNHAVLIVGYGSDQDGKDYWIVKNSWGTSWGIHGYVYIRRNTHLPYGVCAITSFAYYPTQTSFTISPYPSPSPSPSLSPSPSPSPPFFPPPPPSPSPPPPTPPPSPPPPSPSPPPPSPSPPPPTPPPPSPSPPPPSPSPPPPSPTPPSPPPPSPSPPPPSPPPPSPPPPPPSPPPPSPSPPPPSPPPPSPSPPPPSPPPPSPPPPSPSPPPPSPSPPSPPPPRPPQPPQPPHPPPPPPPVYCSYFTYCPPGQTCCCLYQIFNICLAQGCCDYPDAICCPESDYCCPGDFPICNTDIGMCFKHPRVPFGVPAKKKTPAEHKFPWSKRQENDQPMDHQGLSRKTDLFAPML